MIRHIKTPKLTVDVIIEMENNSINLIKRKNPPYGWALPGGFVDVGESVVCAAIREAKEETSLSIYNIRELGVFSEPDRDPRGHTVSVVFYAKGKGKPRAQDDAKEIGLFDIKNLPPLAFDHEKIIGEYSRFKNGMRVIEEALYEDIGSGDITSAKVFGAQDIVKSAHILAKEDFVLSGLFPFISVWQLCNVKVISHCRASDLIKNGSTIFTLSGRIFDLLKGERVALNFLAHLSGIATLTRNFVDRVEGTKVKILDTRKTTPNLRIFEREAVRNGGGNNHRFSLSDLILIKDNHIRAIGGIDKLVKIRKDNSKVKIEIETTNINEVMEALRIKPNIIMLDNFTVKDAKKAIKIINGRAKVEISGGITYQNILEYAECNPDYISIGAITHSARAVDVSMKII